MAFDPATAASYDLPLPGPVHEPAPDRRPGSIRRTSHLDTTRGTGDRASDIVSVVGAARDLLTTNADAQVRGDASLSLAVGPGGVIEAVEHRPGGRSCRSLVGARIGFGFRSAAKSLLAELVGTPLGLLVDDLSGAPAPSGYGTIRERTLLGLPDRALPQGASPGARADVCAGWRANGRAYGNITSGVPLPFEAEPPVAPDLDVGDALGWHAMAPLAARQSRRVRRLDLWRENDRVRVDAMFRDSTADPDRTPRVVHEYALHAVIDAESLTLSEIRAVPRALPFPTDCPFAADSAQLLVGQPVDSLRGAVRTLSTGPVSCTHLNDAFRSLADVAVLIDYLED